MLCQNTSAYAATLAEQPPLRLHGLASVSGDAIALMMTALLGIGSVLIKAKVSKDSDKNQRQIELSRAVYEPGLGFKPSTCTSIVCFCHHLECACCYAIVAYLSV